MTDKELIDGYQKIVNEQSNMLRNCFKIIDGYEQSQKNPPPLPTQGLMPMFAEHWKNNAGEPWEFDALKISDEERRRRFGCRVRLVRKSLEMTQEELAAKIGLTKAAVGSYERGEREPNFRSLIALSRALGTSADWLIGEPSQHIN